jgi:preprotein translocase subunit SecB
MADSNGSNAPRPSAPETRPAIAINAQYIKDLSFENPRAPGSLTGQPQPELQISVDVGATNTGPDRYEVVLHIQARAQSKGEPMFILELAYAALITLQNVSQAELPQALLVETPRMLFPFARAIVADATRDGGFPPVFLQPIDFNELLRRQAAQQAGSATA